MKVQWSISATREVENITRYIARDDHAAAVRWADGVFAATDRLADFPRSGRIVPELGVDRLREIVLGNYRIIYRIDARRVIVLMVLHGRQQLRPSRILPR